MSFPVYGNVLSITVPASSGTYTDTFTGQPGPGSLANNNGGNQAITGLTIVAAGTFVATAVVEIWALSPTPGLDPTQIANYSLYATAVLSAAGGTSVALNGAVDGLLLRVKSGGTAGTQTIWYWASIG